LYEKFWGNGGWAKTEVGSEYMHTEVGCVKRLREAVDVAWGVISNAYDGNWDQAPAEWRQAAERWRDKYVNRPRSGGAPRE
jgi:hypothetical protein